jgi:Ca2+-binding RTX toxin-like protein
MWGDFSTSGDDAPNYLYGNDGDDLLIGGEASDALFGGSGADTLVGTGPSGDYLDAGGDDDVDVVFARDYDWRRMGSEDELRDSDGTVGRGPSTDLPGEM